MKSALRLEGLVCLLPDGVTAVDDLSLEIAPGEFFCLLGPSGCGKSTLLRLISGHQKSLRGRIWIQEREVTAEPPERREVGMVFQRSALFPHLSSLENVAFGLRARGVKNAPRLARANEMLDWVGLTPAERDRRPSELSGGQQQRVALARAIAFGPKLLMLDEPFANLDHLLRERLRAELKEVQRRAGIATILVTHDREEALGLGDRVGIMSRGRLLQVGTPEEVYTHPVSASVARFLGHRNLLPITGVIGCNLQAGGVTAELAPDQTAAVGDHLLIWPERISLHAEPLPGSISAVIQQSRFAGAHRDLVLALANGLLLEIPAPAQNPEFIPGVSVHVSIPLQAISLIRHSADELPLGSRGA